MREPVEVLDCFLADLLATGSFRWRPITLAISRNGTPSSATP
jgi:hypothetical protein